MRRTQRFDDINLTSYSRWKKARDRVKKPPIFGKSRIKPVDDALRGFFGKGKRRMTRQDVYEAIKHVRRTTNADNTYRELLDWVFFELEQLRPIEAELILEPSPEEYAAAYKKARFWYGVSKGDASAIAAQGMKISESCAGIGATNPGRQKLGGQGGPLFLGLAKDISEAYAVQGMFRIFLDRNTCATWVEGGATVFIPNDRRLWRDRDNPGAALVMCDIPSTKILLGTHSDVILSDPGSDRSREIMRCIGSFDTQLPTDHSGLVDLHRAAVEGGHIADRWQDDSGEGKYAVFRELQGR